MTIKITVEKVSDNEVRVTLTGDIRISGDLNVLVRPGDAQIPTSVLNDHDVKGAYLQLLTVDQAAQAMNVSRDMVYDLIRTGQLRSMKIGRLRRIACRWINEFADRSERI